MALKKWKGGAQAVSQVTTITFSAYTSGQTYTVVINQKSVSYTAVASTAADVVSGLIAAIAASGGAEFSTMTASGTTSLILTGNNPGEPTTITASATGGITATVTATTAATGPNHFNNANNWIGGVAPVPTDDMVFEDSSYSVLYALEDTSAMYGYITIDSTFTGEIGLPVQNATGYREYRPRFLKLGDGSSSFALTVGLGTGRQPTRVFIDANAADVTARIYNSGQGVTDEMPVILKNTGGASTLDVYSGKVHVDADTSGSLANLRITPADGGTNNVYVLIDETVDAGAITQTGGTLDVRGSAASINASNNAQARFLLAATCPIIVVANGATVYWESTAGITTSVNVHARGSLDFARNGSAKTVAAAVLYASGSITDPLGIVTWTTGIDLLGCSIQDVTIDLGRGRTITPS